MLLLCCKPLAPSPASVTLTPSGLLVFCRRSSRLVQGSVFMWACGAIDCSNRECDKKLCVLLFTVWDMGTIQASLACPVFSPAFIFPQLHTLISFFLPLFSFKPAILCPPVISSFSPLTFLHFRIVDFYSRLYSL